MAQDKSNNALMQQLKKHFDLQIDPFSEGSQFFFEGAQRQHNLETLRHLASFGDMVLLAQPSFPDKFAWLITKALMNIENDLSGAKSPLNIKSKIETHPGTTMALNNEKMPELVN